MKVRALVAILFVICVVPPAFAQTSRAISLHVKENAGIRRSGYPVNARVPLGKGLLKDTEHVRLTLNEKEVPAQISAESKWPDQSIQWMDVDFNATIAPLEQQTYRVEYGEGVHAGAQPRGLTVSDSSDAIQVGNVRFNKSRAPLVLSVRYRQEDIGSGPNGFAVTDQAGTTHDLSAADNVTVSVTKPGPLYVVIRYSGKLSIDSGYTVPVTVLAEMPNSKTWIKYSASVDDPGKRLRDIVFNTPLAFGPLPWLWDFGTGSWTYGSLRNPTDSVVLTQVVKPGSSGNEWQIKTGAKGQETVYEVAAGARSKVAEGWGHIQDTKEVVAFGFDKFGRQPGTYVVTFDAQGQSAFRFAPGVPAVRHELTIYQHYVAGPTPIGAITSPVSMLNGLTAVCDREQYTKAGVPAP